MTPGYHPSTATDEGGLWQVAEKNEREIRNSRFLVADADLHGYVDGIVERLAPEFHRDIRVYIVRTPYFNANMAPNGMMQVWSGLLLRTLNEAQLAAILGHEFAHYRERHTLQRWRDAQSKGNLAAFLGAGFGAFAIVPNLALMASIYAYSRDQERQADAIGLELMAKAGYKPTAASEIWEQLIAEQAKDMVHKDQDVLLATHPAPEERMTTLRNQAKSYAHASTETYAERYRAHLRAVRLEFLQDELRLRQYARSLYLFDLLEKNGEADGLTAYGIGEVYRLRDEKGDAVRARDKLEQAVTLADCPAEAYRSLGLVQMKGGDRAAADVAFRKYLELAPNAGDQQMIRTYIRAQG